MGKCARGGIRCGRGIFRKGVVRGLFVKKDVLGIFHRTLAAGGLAIREILGGVSIWCYLWWRLCRGVGIFEVFGMCYRGWVYCGVFGCRSM